MKILSVFGLTVIVSFGWAVALHNQEESQKAARNARKTVAASRTVASPQPVRRTFNDPLGVVRAASATYRVRESLLVGIWKKESNGLPSGFGSKKAGWSSPADLVGKNGKCVKEYNAKRCNEELLGLRAICTGQRDGTARVCDPKKVRVSLAFAMGPMQLLPSTILDIQNGKVVGWNGQIAADFDHDGLIDPHSLPDAMAMAARHVRADFDRKTAACAKEQLRKRRPSKGCGDEEQTWIWAVNRYSGPKDIGYYEGDGKRPGVKHYREEWERQQRSVADPPPTLVASTN